MSDLPVLWGDVFSFICKNMYTVISAAKSISINILLSAC